MLSAPGVERRNLVRRSEIAHRLIQTVISDPYSAVTVDVIRDGLDVPPDAAKRLLLKLARAGLLEKRRNGVWVRSTHQPDRNLAL